MDSPWLCYLYLGLADQPCVVQHSQPLQMIMLELQATVSIDKAAVGFLGGYPPEQSLCPWCPPGHSSQAFAMGEG